MVLVCRAVVRYIHEACINCPALPSKSRVHTRITS